MDTYEVPLLEPAEKPQNDDGVSWTAVSSCLGILSLHVQLRDVSSSSTEGEHTKYTVDKFQRRLGPPLTSFTDLARLLPTVRSGWRLTQATKRRLKEQAIHEEANQLFKRVCKAYENNIIDKSDYDDWKGWIMAATEQKNLFFIFWIRSYLQWL
ncbi:hypothetical protein B0H63DRAFT_221667 [Podospora didyma]|uniref:Uncharacterized protein n=1 Tax=Podospora didyma TaxID=330526 RepID=A0AAE0NBW3_9PEZI|nr:hypothetical protein B0H63DRAFT_221667 [Podospora didyma]